MKSVYSAVWTGSLNKADYASSLKGWTGSLNKAVCASSLKGTFGKGIILRSLCVGFIPLCTCKSLRVRSRGKNVWNFLKKCKSCILIRALVSGYTDCENMRSINYIKFDANMYGGS